MESDEYEIVEVARKQLETAIRLFFYSEDYFSVITLAGASEEIFGRILQELGKESSHSSYARTFSLVTEALSGEKISERDIKIGTNITRNRLKHFNSMSDLRIVLNPREDAMHMLGRATGNYVKLNLPESDEISRYIRYSDEHL